MIDLLFLYSTKQKKNFINMNFFYNNLVIRDMIIYFCFVLIDLVNNYKNVYSHNDNVCLGVRMMFFMRAVSIKRGYVMVLYVHCYF